MLKMKMIMVYLIKTVMTINLMKIFVNQENTIGNIQFAWFVLFVENVQGIASVVLVAYDPIENMASKLYQIL